MDFHRETSSVDYYRELLKSAKVFLTELPSENATFKNRNETHSKSSFSSSFQSNSIASSPIPHSNQSQINEQLHLTRQSCHQRLLSCSRKKLRLLNLQEQNDKRHSGFQSFIENLNEKRSSNIYRYQIELKEYLLKRLETDRLKQEVNCLNQKIDQLKTAKLPYYPIIEIVQKSIPLFPPGALQLGTDGLKSLMLRYETLVETKQQFQQRDYSKQKLKQRQKLQQWLVEHNTRIAKLSTQIAQLHHKLNSIQTNQSNQEDLFISKIDLIRYNTTTKSQLESSINSLYDRYRLFYQFENEQPQTTIQKLRSIQEYILYKNDLLQQAKTLKTI